MRTGWPVTLALAAGGSLAGHWLAYRVVTPDAGARTHELADSGHGYLSLAPSLLTSLYALALLALCLRAVAAHRGRDVPRLPAWSHAAIPPLAFVLQEHAERAIHDGAVPTGAVLEPTFAVGFAIQIPFALAAVCAARLLLRGADRAAGALAAARTLRAPAFPSAAQVAVAVILPRLRPAAGCAAGRAPPSLL